MSPTLWFLAAMFVGIPLYLVFGRWIGKPAVKFLVIAFFVLTTLDKKTGVESGIQEFTQSIWPNWFVRTIWPIFIVITLVLDAGIFIADIFRLAWRFGKG